jgi:hypothetical protein
MSSTDRGTGCTVPYPSTPTTYFSEPSEPSPNLISVGVAELSVIDRVAGEGLIAALIGMGPGL